MCFGARKAQAVNPPPVPPPPPPPPTLPDSGIQQAGADYRKRIKNIGSDMGAIVNSGGAAGLVTPASTSAKMTLGG